MAGTFDFCPASQVPEELPPEPLQGMSMNSWSFSAKPTVPYQAKWKVTLYGLQWYLQSNGMFDAATDPTHNARRLELFYRARQTWDTFTWSHPHIGPLLVRFETPVIIPAGMTNSNGQVGPIDVTFVHHNPSYV
jgi:hypothetical protein